MPIFKFCPLALAYCCKKLRLHYTYIGTGYLFAYDNGEHKVGGKGFEEGGKEQIKNEIMPFNESNFIILANFLFSDLPTFFGNSYSVVKGFTDRMLNHLTLTEAINARITLPLNYELQEDRNLLSKIITYR